MTVPSRRPARLRWTGADALDEATRAALLGPGAPLELVTEDVLGAPVEVFARRPPHLPAVMDSAVGRHGDLPFLVTHDRQRTFTETRRAADAVAGVLAERYGVTRGDRVAIVGANTPEYVIGAWATLRLGAIVTGLNGWWSAPELEYGIDLSEPAVLLGDERRLARLDGSPQLGRLPVEQLGALVADVEGGGEAEVSSPTVELHEDDPAVILFTSGTTGRPKAATLSHRNLVHFGLVNALNGAVRMAVMAASDGGSSAAPPGAISSGAAAQGAALAASPMFHVSGLLAFLMTGPVFGFKLVFLPPGRWDEGEHLRLTEQHRVTNWSGVPTQYWRLLDRLEAEPHDVSSVQTLGSGGAPYPPDLVRRIRRVLPHATINDGFGMSETAGLGTVTSGDAIAEHPGTVGGAQATSEVEVRDPLDRPLPEGEVGEICLRNASVFLGYWGDETATAEALDEERWYRTGDYGRIEDGRLYLESRRRDLILRGGENIYPIEIEHRLVDHPDIADAAVIGVPHPVLGQEVKAFVVPRPGATVTVAEVQQWAADALAAFKVPAHVELRTELPYTESGKLLKQELERQESDRQTST